MDVFDKFFQQHAYKFDKGYPDMNNDQDVFLLESILLNEFGIDLNEAYNPLRFYDLQKYGGPRLKKLASKIKNNEPFDLVSGEQVALKFKESSYEPLFTNADVTGIRSLTRSGINSFPFFVDKIGKEYVITDLLKNVEFGGRGTGSGTRVEDIALTDVNSKIQELGPIDVKLSPNGEVYKDIVKATSVTGVPKADFTFDTESGPVVFISHKDGSGPKDFQQYSGFKGLSDHPEVKSFIDAVKQDSGGELQRRESYRRKINDDSIKLRAVYGLDQQVGNYGKNNCQVILQGPIELKLDDSNGSYLIEANHKVINPDLPVGDYEPYMYVTYRSDRNNEGVKNARFGTYPEAYKRNAKEI